MMQKYYFTSFDYNKFTNNILDAKIKENLVNETNTSGFINNSDLDKKIATIDEKAELKVEPDKIVKLQSFDSSYLRVKSYFEDDLTQIYLLFQTIYRFFKRTCNTDHISAWKLKGLPDKNIKSPATSDNSLAPS